MYSGFNSLVQPRVADPDTFLLVESKTDLLGTPVLTNKCLNLMLDLVIETEPDFVTTTP